MKFLSVLFSSKNYYTVFSSFMLFYFLLFDPLKYYRTYIYIERLTTVIYMKIENKQKNTNSRLFSPLLAPLFYNSISSLLNVGNNITSLIDCELVSNITSLSIPSPNPPAGGIPYSSALM
jgi:hypothetical protein